MLMRMLLAPEPTSWAKIPCMDGEPTDPETRVWVDVSVQKLMIRCTDGTTYSTPLLLEDSTGGYGEGYDEAYHGSEGSEGDDWEDATAPEYWDTSDESWRNFSWDDGWTAVTSGDARMIPDASMSPGGVTAVRLTFSSSESSLDVHFGGNLVVDVQSGVACSVTGGLSKLDFYWFGGGEATIEIEKIEVTRA